MALWENLHPGLQETGVPVPAPQGIGLLCVLEQTLCKTDSITLAHPLVETASFHCNLAMAGIKKYKAGPPSV